MRSGRQEEAVDARTPVLQLLRRKTRTVRAGSLLIGSGFPVSVQTMWKESLSRDALPRVLEAVQAFGRRGCDIIRFAVPDSESVSVLGALALCSPLPVVADIHFDHRLALQCLDHPVAKIRINPGTLGEEWKVRDVAAKARDSGRCIRVGINAGSLPRELDTEPDVAAAMVKAAEMELEVLDRVGFHDAVFSLKSSDIWTTVEANTRFSERYDFPLHIGVTEAGPLNQGIVRNAIGISELLSNGIGDTIRVSLSADPAQEIDAGVEIVRSMGLRSGGTSVVACPTCGRTTFDVKSFLEQVSDIIQNKEVSLSIAIMGCVVNGPGEARHADLGITGSGKVALIFRKGKVIRQVNSEEAEAAFREEYDKACRGE
jgi:(E)-4-hydroxy-3-methylbut-2-enyl-diphosphate synthase